MHAIKHSTLMLRQTDQQVALVRTFQLFHVIINLLPQLGVGLDHIVKIDLTLILFLFQLLAALHPSFDCRLHTTMTSQLNVKSSSYLSFTHTERPQHVHCTIPRSSSRQCHTLVRNAAVCQTAQLPLIETVALPHPTSCEAQRCASPSPCARLPNPPFRRAAIAATAHVHPRYERRLHCQQIGTEAQ